MGRRIPTPDELPGLAARFRALSDPTRLELLSLLHEGEHTVSSLVSRTGQGQANVSKHLQQLHAQGFVTRRRAGLYAYYRLADRQVMRLCAQMLARTDDGREVVAERSAGR
jgi:DNA-binding transcriptional ArsR family regulator